MSHHRDHHPATNRPRRHRLAVAALAAIAVVAGGVNGSAASPAPARAASVVPVLDWSDCGDGLQCATASVPLDHDRPNGRHIDLAVIRRPAGDPDRRIGSLFVNNGGPATR